MTPGIKTSEFWLHLLVILLGGFIALLPHASSITQGIGTAATLVSALGYGSSRARLKATALSFVDDVVDTEKKLSS